MTSAYLNRTFEYIDPAHNDTNIEIRITFNYRAGHPAQTYGDPENCYPAGGPEREYISAERETTPGQWVPIADAEWLNEWCVAAFDAADDDDLIQALPERDADEDREFYDDTQDLMDRDRE